MDIILKTPTSDYAEDIWQFRNEILNSKDNDMFAGCGTLKNCLSPNVKSRIKKSKRNKHK